MTDRNGQRTLTQLNRTDDRHKVAFAVFHGKHGRELRQRYREGQEDDPLGALGLRQIIVL